MAVPDAMTKAVDAPWQAGFYHRATTQEENDMSLDAILIVSLYIACELIANTTAKNYRCAWFRSL